MTGTAAERRRLRSRFRRLSFEMIEERCLLTTLPALEPPSSLPDAEALAGESGAEIRIAVSDAAGNVIDSAAPQESFLIQIYVADVRESPLGVFAAYLDLHFDEDRVQRSGDPVFGDIYSNAVHLGDDTPGVLDEVGAFSNSVPPIGGGSFLLASVPFRARSPGRFSFQAQPADLVPQSLVLLYGDYAALDSRQIRFGSLAFEVRKPLSDSGRLLPPASGEPKSLTDFPWSAADEAVAFELTWRAASGWDADPMLRYVAATRVAVTSESVAPGIFSSLDWDSTWYLTAPVESGAWIDVESARPTALPLFTDRSRNSSWSPWSHSVEAGWEDRGATSPRDPLSGRAIIVVDREWLRLGFQRVLMGGGGIGMSHLRHRAATGDGMLDLMTIAYGMTEVDESLDQHHRVLAEWDAWPAAEARHPERGSPPIVVSAGHAHAPAVEVDAPEVSDPQPATPLLPADQRRAQSRPGDALPDATSNDELGDAPAA